MLNIRCFLLFATSFATSQAAIALDTPETVEILRDAQATNGNAWRRGQASLRLEISNDGKPGIAAVDGDVSWDRANLLLRFKVSDPEGIHFPDRGRSLDTEWNFIARNAKAVITYAARDDALSQRDATPNAFEPIYNLAMPTLFTMCCPPHASQGRYWSAMIGPADSVPEVFRSSKFTYRTVGGGDIEQTRLDESGHKLVTVFSAKHQFAVRSATQYDPNGSIGQEHLYEYVSLGDGSPVPSLAVSRVTSAKTKAKITYKYKYSNVRLPGDVTPALFTTESVLARLRRETDAGRRSPSKKKAVVDDSSLDALYKSLRESGSARPRPR